MRYYKHYNTIIEYCYFSSHTTLCYETIIIDHNDYKKVILYKTRILYLLFCSSKEIVIRYPLFSLSEMVEYYNSRHIVINQLYV